ncbi:MAG: hypothetical protein ACNA8H_06030 [Anaerolineales bacterium]
MIDLTHLAGVGEEQPFPTLPEASRAAHRQVAPVRRPADLDGLVLACLPQAAQLHFRQRIHPHPARRSQRHPTPLRRPGLRDYQGAHFGGCQELERRSRRVQRPQPDLVSHPVHLHAPALPVQLQVPPVWGNAAHPLVSPRQLLDLAILGMVQDHSGLPALDPSLGEHQVIAVPVLDGLAVGDPGGLTRRVLAGDRRVAEQHLCHRDNPRVQVDQQRSPLQRLVDQKERLAQPVSPQAGFSVEGGLPAHGNFDRSCLRVGDAGLHLVLPFPRPRRPGAEPPCGGQAWIRDNLESAGTQGLDALLLAGRPAHRRVSAQDMHAAVNLPLQEAAMLPVVVVLGLTGEGALPARAHLDEHQLPRRVTEVPVLGRGEAPVSEDFAIRGPALQADHLGGHQGLQKGRWGDLDNRRCGEDRRGCLDGGQRGLGVYRSNLPGCGKGKCGLETAWFFFQGFTVQGGACGHPCNQ